MAIQNYSYEQFNANFAVSRETYVKLELYVSLLEKWQKSINLISATTLHDVWKRHVIDSYQLIKLLSSSDRLLDIGSGAGLPGIVLAIAGTKIALVESDGKKVAFLREAARILELDFTIFHQRIEDVPLQGASTITARACASVVTIMNMLASRLTSSHNLLLLKGKSYREELAEAAESYVFDVKEYPSITDASGVILLINNIQQRGVKPL